MGNVRKPGKNQPANHAPTKPVLPGKTKPTWHDAAKPTHGDSTTWLFPDKKYESGEAPAGQIICPTCQAISDSKHWHMDPELYQQLRLGPDVKVKQCPACEQISKQMYDGEVVLQGTFVQEHKEEILNFVRNEESRAMHNNPMARLATVEERGDNEIYILTIGEVLARRIGNGLRSAFEGDLTIQAVPQEEFTRVRWKRD